MRIKTTATGKYRFHFTDRETGRRRASQFYNNTMCLAGLSLVMGLLNLEGTVITPVYGAVGNGASPALDTSDVALSAEIGRVVLATNFRTTNTNVWDFFFTTSQGNPGSGSLTEAGIFLAATATANSGTMLSHVLINEAKTSAETMTMEFIMALTSGD